MIQDHLDHGASKELIKPLPRVVLLVSLMHHDTNDLESLILLQIMYVHLHFFTVCCLLRIK